MIIRIQQKQEKYAVMAISGEVIVVTNSAEYAAKEAKHATKSYRREAITCCWIGVDELKSKLIESKTKMQEHSRKLESRLYDDGIREIDHLLKTL